MTGNAKNKSIKSVLTIVSRALPVLFLAALLPLFGGCITPRIDDSAPGAGARLDGRQADPAASELAMRPPGPGLPAATTASAPASAPPAMQRPGPRPVAPAAGRPVIPLEVNQGGPYRLKIGDPVLIVMRNTLGEIADFIDENGDITLPYVDKIRAVGHTSAELEAKIQSIYVPDYYKFMTVNVVVATQRSYFMRGEIRRPGRVPYIGGTTLAEAIASAGGFTDFANAKKITITRGTRITTHNFLEIEKNPDQDVAIEAGDIISVPRGWM